MNELERIKFQFHKKEDGSLDIEHFGQFRMGLTQLEVKDYLRARANKLSIEKLYKKFHEIAGRNTMSSSRCLDCNVSYSLMYRWDVERFADVLFGVTKETYFD